MSALRHRRIGRTGPLGDEFNGTYEERTKSELTSVRKFVQLVVRLTPYVMLFVHLVLLLYMCLSPSAPPPPAPELGQLLTAVTSALQAHNITHWLAPGAELLEHGPGRASFTRYHRSLTLGVLHGHALDVVVALAEMHSPTVFSVETHAGLRVFFPATAPEEHESVFDYRHPFLDLHYFRPDGALYVNFCCSCASTQVSACTKKLCGCLVCAVHRDALFPLGLLRIAGVSRAVPAPHAIASVLLRRDAADLHPLALQGVTSTAAS